MSEAVGFSISPRTIRMIGRQNVSSQFVAINELIKNAYDADAPAVEIILRGNISKKKGSIEIRDGGSGMDLETIKNKWLTIGTDNKEREPISPRGRIRTGAKGIGRFALDRLGLKSTLTTFTAPDEPGVRLIIDWSKYDDSSADFTKVLHEYSFIENPNSVTGTSILIELLHDSWSEADMIEMYTDLSFLTNDLGDSFDIFIQTDEYPEVNGKVEAATFDAAEFEMISDLNKDGAIVHRISHKSGFSIQREMKWSEDVIGQPSLILIPPSCGSVHMSIRFYLTQEGLRGRSANARETAYKRYIKSVRGIKIYRDDFLVKPYGVDNYDWLNLNPRKMRHNEGVLQAKIGDYRIANHQLIGKIKISRLENPNLQDRANREGLIDNQAFKDLKKFVLSAIRLLEFERQNYEKNKQKTSNSSENEDPKKTLSDEEQISKLEQQLKQLNAENTEDTAKIDEGEVGSDDGADSGHTGDYHDPAPATDDKESVDNNTQDTSNQQVAEEAVAIARKLLDDNRMLRTLASVGISAITLSHEIKSDLVLISNGTGLVERLIRRSIIDHAKIDSEISTVKQSTMRLNEWSELLLERVKSRKRTIGIYKISEEINILLNRYSNAINRNNINFCCNIIGDEVAIKYTPLDIEAIVLNLLSNAVKSIKNSSNTTRQVEVLIDYSESGRVLLTVADSGTGIRHQGRVLSVDECGQIFDPLVSYDKVEGTGMGLFIVKSICESNGWSVAPIPLNDMGGASFIISIEGQVDARE